MCVCVYMLCVEACRVWLPTRWCILCITDSLGVPKEEPLRCLERIPVNVVPGAFAIAFQANALPRTKKSQARVTLHAVRTDTDGQVCDRQAIQLVFSHMLWEGASTSAVASGTAPVGPLELTEGAWNDVLWDCGLVFELGDTLSLWLEGSDCSGVVHRGVRLTSSFSDAQPPRDAVVVDPPSAVTKTEGALMKDCGVPISMDWGCGSAQWQ